MSVHGPRVHLASRGHQKAEVESCLPCFPVRGAPPFPAISPSLCHIVTTDRQRWQSALPGSHERARSWQASQASAKTLRQHEAAAWQDEIFPRSDRDRSQEFPQNPRIPSFFPPAINPAPQCARPNCLETAYASPTISHLNMFGDLGFNPAPHPWHGHTRDATCSPRHHKPHHTPCSRQVTELADSHEGM